MKPVTHSNRQFVSNPRGPDKSSPTASGARHCLQATQTIPIGENHEQVELTLAYINDPPDTLNPLPKSIALPENRTESELGEKQREIGDSEHSQALHCTERFNSVAAMNLVSELGVSAESAGKLAQGMQNAQIEHNSTNLPTTSPITLGDMFFDLHLLPKHQGNADRFYPNSDWTSERHVTDRQWQTTGSVFSKNILNKTTDTKSNTDYLYIGPDRDQADISSTRESKWWEFFDGFNKATIGTSTSAREIHSPTWGDRFISFWKKLWN